MSQNRNPVANLEEQSKTFIKADDEDTTKSVDENKPARCTPEERPKSAFIGRRVNINVPIEPKDGENKSTELNNDKRVKTAIEESLKKQVKERELNKSNTTKSPIENCFKSNQNCTKNDNISVPRNISTKPKSIQETTTRISIDERVKIAIEEGLKEVKNVQDSNMPKSRASQPITDEQRFQNAAERLRNLIHNGNTNKKVSDNVAKEKIDDNVKQIIEKHINRLLNDKEPNEDQQQSVQEENTRKIQTVEEAHLQERQQQFISAAENLAKMRRAM